ncbi:MAG: DUF2314 domain-containing protein [Sterolibacteriaceae bacterium]|nr:DUF2314 domain-containing protein [Candidatus Methylophosphatis haderslevensis]
MTFIRFSFLAVVALCIGSAHAKPGQPLSARSWQPESVGFAIGLYYLRVPGSDPVKAARTLAADRWFARKVVETLDMTARDQSLMSIAYSSKVAEDYAPPSLRALSYFGRGLSSEQVEALQKAPRVLALGFAHPASQSAVGLRNAEKLVFELAQQENAIIYDVETREAFTPEVWRRSRLETWEGGTPDVSKQIVIHAYNAGGSIRSISLGMTRLGLPDLVVNDSVWSLNRPLGNTINALAQQLVERGRPDETGAMHLNVGGLRHAGVRKRLLEAILPGGKGAGRLRLLETPTEEGDPANALVALNFDFYPGRDATERQTNFVATVFGAEPDKVVHTKHDAAIRAASARARAKLPGLQKAFQDGLAPGEQLLIKAPFSTRAGGQEWMWVEVTQWNGDQIRGMLRSDPRDVPGLSAGQMVGARGSEVFDYLRVFPDGRTEGNETSNLLK